MNVLVKTDGASRGNPGKAGIGIFIMKDDEVNVYKEFIGNATNNVAEYIAFIRAIDILNVKPQDKIIFQSDSELMVNQINGKYKVNNESLKELKEEAINKLKNRFAGMWSIVHIPREENREADKLANEAIDESEKVNKVSVENFQLNFK
ncbi:MAG TPA: ribonuclease HI family protein [Ignavibacteria bacterium]|nr:ribonuclease HI family protein [Ignavibacteria bacterium]